MATIVCVLGDKGGIGKSTWARGLADVLRARGVTTALFDGDWMCRSLFKVFCATTSDGTVVSLSKQDPRSGCILYDIHHRELGRDLLLNSMGLPDVDVVLHDLPAGFRADFTRIMGIAQPAKALQEFATSARNLGVQPVFVTILTPLWATHQTAVWLAETLKGQARVVAVRNEQFHEEAFHLWRDGDQARFVQAGGLEIAMPGLDPQTFMACETHAVRLASAGGHQALSLAEKLRVASWQRRFEAELATIGEVFALKPVAALAAGESATVV